MDADLSQCSDALRQRVRVQLLRQEPGIPRHNRAGLGGARIVHMVEVPGVRVFAADAMQIRTRSLGTPKERVFVDIFARLRVFAVAFGFRAEWTNHLRMTADA